MVNRCTFSKDDFRIYAMDVDFNKNKDVKPNSYGNVTIMGDIQDLDYNTKYKIIGVPTSNKYGITYKVTGISRDKPTNEKETYQFLRSICTENQASALYLQYPDIIKRVMDGEDIDLTYVRGIKEKTFAKIKEKIIDNFMLMELINEFKGGVSLALLRKMYTEYASIKVVRKKIIEEPYKCMCSLSGVGFKTADEILLKLQKDKVIDFGYDLKTSIQRCRGCIIYYLEENENSGSTRINILDLHKMVKNSISECASHFFEAIKDDEIIFNKNDNNDIYVSKKSTYDTEMYIKNRISEAIKINKIFDIDIEKYRKLDEYELTDDQLSSIDNLCKNQFSILVGYSGTGKSSSVKAVINMLQDNFKVFNMFAPTGKAAKVLAEYTGQRVETIHTGLGYIPPHWTFNEDNKLYCDFLIIDEFSMTDIFLFERVLRAIDFNQTKLMVIGDPAQLPSVACGNVMHDLLSDKSIARTMLTEVFRYGEGGLMKIATDVRNCKPYLENITERISTFGDNKDYTFMDFDKTAGLDCVKKVYSKLLNTYNPCDIMVLSCYRKGDFGCTNINRLLQPLANPNVNQKKSLSIESGGTSYYVNDIVMQTQNNRKAQIVEKVELWGETRYEFIDEEVFIANGESGIILDIANNLIIIDFNGIIVGYEKSDMQNIELGYACTCHKMQGASSKIVILFTPSSHCFMLNSNILYVGLTRMKEKIFHVGDSKSVNKAVLKKENLSRNTWLSCG